MPTEDEQAAIVASVDARVTSVEDLLSRVHDAVDRLKELRTALISAAVTGKIDVRSASSGATADIGGAA